MRASGGRNRRLDRGDATRRWPRSRNRAERRSRRLGGGCAPADDMTRCYPVTRCSKMYMTEPTRRRGPDGRDGRPFEPRRSFEPHGVGCRRARGLGRAARRPGERQAGRAFESRRSRARPVRAARRSAARRTDGPASVVETGGASGAVAAPVRRFRPRASCSGAAWLPSSRIAWVWVGRGATTDSTSVPATTVATRPRPRVETVAVSVPGWVPDAIAATCGAHRSEKTRVVTVDCTPGRGVLALQYRGFSSVTAMRAAYAATSPLVGGSGSPGCERGTHEERSWSAPASPTVPSGRYQCSLVGGRARLVWTSERSRVLATASRDDGDLRSLFQWWTTVPGPSDGEQLRDGG